MPFKTLYYETNSDAQKVVKVGQTALSQVIWRREADLRLQLQPPSVVLDILPPSHKHSHQNQDVNIGAPFTSDSINWFKCPKYQKDPGWSHMVQLIFSSLLLMMEFLGAALSAWPCCFEGQLFDRLSLSWGSLDIAWGLDSDCNLHALQKSCFCGLCVLSGGTWVQPVLSVTRLTARLKDVDPVSTIKQLFPRFN